MSRKRQPGNTGDADVRTFAVRYPSGAIVPGHAHGWHQLVYASDGVMTVHTTPGTWVVPPHRAVWVPAGVEHRIEMSGAVLVQTLYVATGLSDALPEECCAVNVSPLLRELIVHVVGLGTLDRRHPARGRLLGVLLDQLEAMPTIPLQLPLPRDPRAARVAAWLREHPDSPGLLKQVARRAAACGQSNGCFARRRE